MHKIHLVIVMRGSFSAYFTNIPTKPSQNGLASPCFSICINTDSRSHARRLNTSLDSRHRRPCLGSAWAHAYTAVLGVDVDRLFKEESGRNAVPCSERHSTSGAFDCIRLDFEEGIRRDIGRSQPGVRPAALVVKCGRLTDPETRVRAVWLTTSSLPSLYVPNSPLHCLDELA